MRFTLLANIHPTLRNVGVETTITKPSGIPGRVGMLVTVPLRKRLFVFRKEVPSTSTTSRLGRANVLTEVLNTYVALDLKSRKDKSRAGQTTKEWILFGPKVGKECSAEQQLRQYAQSADIEKWKNNGYTITPVLVVVIGSRHVILWNLDGATLDSSSRLALE